MCRATKIKSRRRWVDTRLHMGTHECIHTDTHTEKRLQKKFTNWASEGNWSKGDLSIWVKSRKFDSLVTLHLANNIPVIKKQNQTKKKKAQQPHPDTCHCPCLPFMLFDLSNRLSVHSDWFLNSHLDWWMKSEMTVSSWRKLVCVQNMRSLKTGCSEARNGSFPSCLLSNYKWL